MFCSNFLTAFGNLGENVKSYFWIDPGLRYCHVSMKRRKKRRRRRRVRRKRKRGKRKRKKRKGKGKKEKEVPAFTELIF